MRLRGGRALGAVMILALVLGACSAPAPQQPAAGGNPTAPAPAQSGGVNQAASSKRGGTLRIPLLGDPSFSAITAQDPSAGVVRPFLYDMLLKPDPKTLDPVPMLARSWDVSPDGLTYTFHLQENVKWHDGVPFTADDVKFTFDAYLDPKNASALRSNFSAMDHIDVVDPLTVRFVLKSKFAPLPVQLYFKTPAIQPKHILEGKDLKTFDEFNKKNPIGTGPYKLKEYVPGDHVTLVANEDYWAGRPNIDTVVMRIVPDINTQVAQVKAGEQDLLLMEPANVSAVEGSSNVVVDTADVVNHYLIELNNQSPLFKDTRVRQAMVLATDRQALIDVAMNGKATFPVGTIPDAIGWAFNSSLPRLGYDLDRAKALLAEAGWKPNAQGVLEKDGQPFKFTLTLDKGNPSRERIAALAQQQYKKLGLDVTLETLDLGTFVQQRLNARKYDALIIWWYTAPDGDQLPYYGTGGALNAPQYSNPEVDRLLTGAREESDQAKRKDLLFKYQEEFQKDPASVVLFYARDVVARNAKLQGRPLLQYVDSLVYAPSFYFEK